MTDVSAVTGTGQASTSVNADVTKSSNEVDYDAFLTLLVAQLKNQDPTEPVDAEQYLAQLASFSSVEQQIKTNDKLAELLAAQQIGQASNLIGKFVAVEGSPETRQVASVTLADNGVIANLEDGTKLPITSGVQIFDQRPQQS